ncbi:MAG: hypothetical protein IPO00_15200 [Betaproteobacteria bacterium]|nr:hypothetical protein [Betaproteobacteria bacterium]
MRFPRLFSSRCSPWARPHTTIAAAASCISITAPNPACAICGASDYRRYENKLDAYAVVGNDGSVVTVGHRTRRIPRS